MFNNADLMIGLEYDLRKRTARIDTNVKRDKVAELLGEYLLSCVGQGKDDAPPTKKNVYCIKLGLVLSEDQWLVEHDCGNKGLREGILMDIVSLLNDSPENITWV